MKRHLNTLYVTTQGTYLAKDGETVAVRLDGKSLHRIPIHTLQRVVCFGQIGFSPFLLGFCADRGVGVSFLTENGRFLARVCGPVSGNVLLRREQYRRADSPSISSTLARSMVAGKIANCRTNLQRANRDHGDAAGSEAVRLAAARLGQYLASLRTERSLDGVRGVEGGAGRAYFSVFDHLIVQQKEDFRFQSRSRRPPLDEVNALLSFLYTLLLGDVRAGLESVGLDPQVGFLHRDRPGRPGLALDLMEELRPVMADRLVLSLINLRALKMSDFERKDTGGVFLTDKGRKAVLVAYQKRKQEEVRHPFLEERVTFGLVPHLQALLLSRHLRGDLDGYPPFIIR